MNPRRLVPLCVVLAALAGGCARGGRSHGSPPSSDSPGAGRPDRPPIIGDVAGDGREGFGGDGGPATAARLLHPQGVALDGAGNVYVADTDNRRVRKVAPDGIISTIAGTGEAGSEGDGGPAVAARLVRPESVALDSAGGLYIADTDAHRIRFVAPATATGAATITTFAGDGAPGFSGDGGPPAAARLSHPTGIVFDPYTGDLLIVDAGNNRIRRVRAGVVATVAGSGTPGSAGDGGPATLAELRLSANYFRMGAVAVDPAGNLYIADSGNHVIRKVDAAGIITRFAGAGTYSRGGDGAAALDAGLAFPAGLAYLPTDGLLVADTANQDLRRIDLPSRLIAHVAGIGFPDDGGNGGPAHLAGLRVPIGLAVPTNGDRIYIADVENNRVRLISKP